MPFFQYAYAMVIWYVSMSNAVVRLFVHGGMRRAPPAEPPDAGLRGAIAEASAGTNHAGRRIDASGRFCMTHRGTGVDCQACAST